jgi:hypothetical protein
MILDLSGSPNGSGSVVPISPTICPGSRNQTSEHRPLHDDVERNEIDRRPTAEQQERKVMNKVLIGCGLAIASMAMSVGTARGAGRGGTSFCSGSGDRIDVEGARYRRPHNPSSSSRCTLGNGPTVTRDNPQFP